VAASAALDCSASALAWPAASARSASALSSLRCTMSWRAASARVCRSAIVAVISSTSACFALSLERAASTSSQLG
jgi:hypothetical protein